MSHHIVFVEIGYPRPSGNIGGAGTYIQIYAHQLIGLGLEVSVICGTMVDGTALFNDRGVSVYPIIKSGPFHYYLSKIPGIKIFAPLAKYLETGWKIHRQLINLNRRKKINIVEYSEGGDFWNALFKRFRYTVHLHGSAYTFKKNSGQGVNRSDWLQRKAELLFIRRANSVVSPCNAMVKLVENEMGTSLVDPHVIPYPMYEKQIEFLQNDDKISPKNKVIIFFASRNDPVKGGELLINALKQLPDESKSKIEVRFYGYHPQQDISELGFLHHYNFVQKDVLLEAYNEADICIIPSFFDNSPNTVYEAMGSGKIVIASDVGGIPEIINNKECGFLFRSGDVIDLTDKLLLGIQLVIRNNHLSMQVAARNRILNLIDLKNNTRKRVQLILQE